MGLNDWVVDGKGEGRKRRDEEECVRGSFNFRYIIWGVRGIVKWR